MISKKFTLATLLAISLFVGQNAQAKEAALPKLKPYFPMVAKALDIAEGRTEAVLLFEFFDSCAALAQIDKRPFAKNMGAITAKLASIIKTPKKYTQAEKEKTLENFIALSDTMTIEDKVVRFNDKKALEKTADILVNHGWSLPGQQLNGIFMLQRLAFEGLAAVFGNTNSIPFKEIRTANNIIKRAGNYSVKEVTDALVALEANIPVIFTEIIANIDNLDPKTFTLGRDFKEYQECLAYMPKLAAPAQVPAKE